MSGAEVKASVVEFSADEVSVALVDPVDFAPDLVFDLSVCWRGGDHYRVVVVGHEPPDDGESGGVGLAGPFGRVDCDPTIVAEGVEDPSLIGSERHAEALGYEPAGLVSPFVVFLRCRGVSGGYVH